MVHTCELQIVCITLPLWHCCAYSLHSLGLVLLIPWNLPQTCHIPSFLKIYGLHCIFSFSVTALGIDLSESHCLALGTFFWNPTASILDLTILALGLLIKLALHGSQSRFATSWSSVQTSWNSGCRSLLALGGLNIMNKIHMQHSKMVLWSALLKEKSFIFEGWGLADSSREIKPFWWFIIEYLTSF